MSEYAFGSTVGQIRTWNRTIDSMSHRQPGNRLQGHWRCLKPTSSSLALFPPAELDGPLGRACRLGPLLRGEKRDALGGGDQPVAAAELETVGGERAVRIALVFEDRIGRQDHAGARPQLIPGGGTDGRRGVGRKGRVPRGRGVAAGQDARGGEAPSEEGRGVAGRLAAMAGEGRHGGGGAAPVPRAQSLPGVRIVGGPPRNVAAGQRGAWRGGDGGDGGSEKQHRPDTGSDRCEIAVFGRARLLTGPWSRCRSGWGWRGRPDRAERRGWRRWGPRRGRCR